ncbi:MAG: hypothetical protein KF730_09740 [Sphingomonas sp.]|uniref:hypothetical protein n=1 Tax=Sphingomonas sp. TaxID=28214 RepID=UPI0025E87DF0|nr:hypothetical protein [Sphingomonas sp.]MBX3564845.1 hypothetical protein [Sphingomonas sp.]
MKPEESPATQTRIFLVDDLADGFRIRSNPKYGSWPVNVRVEMAYADGSRRPKWTRFDFDPEKLPISKSGCAEIKMTNNVLVCRECESDFHLEVTGFDNRRELVTNIRPFRNA